MHGPIRFRKVIQEILDTLNKLDLPELDAASIEALQDEVAALHDRKLVQVVVNGAEADANIAIAGIKKATDKIVSVIRFDKAAEGKLEGISHLTAEAAITSDGNIQLADTNTTGDSLLVSYYDADGNA
jgi:malonyl CoA-acyl carrier protein transacylase